jgi:outer membrane protein OmpA-like peptidoglycan-associated protein
MIHAQRNLLGLGLAVLGTVALARPAHADPASGVDVALFRPSIDTGGVFSLEGARLMPLRDISWKTLVGFSQKPFAASVPGIGTDDSADAVLDYTLTLDMAFGMTLSKKLGIGFDVAAYRTNTGDGYGARGRYAADEDSRIPSTGLISLRPLSNIDPSGGFLAEGLAGPLDVRVVAKYALKTDTKMAISLMGAAVVPFGEDEMFLGDHGLVIEPRVLFDYRFDQVHSTRFVANLGARFRDRTVLEAYDPNTQEMDEATVVADVGSEIIAGAGFVFEAGPKILISAEAMGFIPLPGALAMGDCHTYSGESCDDLLASDYFAGGGAGDLAAYANAGVGYRASPHTTVDLMGGAGLVGKRKDDFHIVLGVTWSPQPKGVAELGRGDKDRDGIPDVSDACIDDTEDKDGYQDDDGCPDVDNDGDGVVDANDTCADEPEDRDGFQDDDGCPERDNDGDSITDVADRCPDQAEDVDGYEDDDGCPDEDNDNDSFPDKDDKCPNDAETVNGFEDDDGCPDVRSTNLPEEGTDRINLKGNKIDFAAGSDKLTNATKTILGQVAQLITSRSLRIRVEVHVPLGTKSKDKKKIKKQQVKDKDLSQRRADVIEAYLRAQGVAVQQIQAVGIGSDRPLGNNVATDPANERVDFIKAQQ